MTIPTDINLLIPVVLITLNQGLKASFNMDSKFAILINWVGGVILNIILLYPFMDSKSLVMAIITGFLLGSSAGGLYDGAKPIATTIKNAIQ